MLATLGMLSFGEEIIPNCATITSEPLRTTRGDWLMGTEAFTVRADSKKVKQLDRLAKLEDRSRNYLVNQAIDQLLDLQAWQAERTKDGIRAADDGRFASDAEMDRIFNNDNAQ